MFCPRHLTPPLPVLSQPPVPVKGLDGLLRTSLDLELDLQVSRTRQARLAQELRVLRELKTQLEKARQQGQKELPAWVQEDERFRLLLRQAEKQVNLTQSVQGSRGASVHMLHGEINFCVLILLFMCR